MDEVLGYQAEKTYFKRNPRFAIKLISNGTKAHFVAIFIAILVAIFFSPLQKSENDKRWFSCSILLQSIIPTKIVNNTKSRTRVSQLTKGRGSTNRREVNLWIWNPYLAQQPYPSPWIQILRDCCMLSFSRSNNHWRSSTESPLNSVKNSHQKKKFRHNKNLEAKISADSVCPVSKAQTSFAPSQTFPLKNEEQTDWRVAAERSKF